MWLWRGVLAFDRLTQRVPSILQIWFVEFLAIMGLSLGLGRLFDGLGLGGCPRDPNAMDGTTFGVIGFGLVMAAIAVWPILRPRIKRITWTPTFVAREVGPFSHVAVPMAAGTVSYDLLTSHPSYGLITIFTAPVPLVGVIAGFDGCRYSFFALFGRTGFALVGLLIALRLVSWYGLKLGRREIEAATPPGWSLARVEWELAWRPLLAAVAVLGGIFVIVLGIAWLTPN